MTRILGHILSVLLFVLAIILLDLGCDWLTLGIGLLPWLAFPWAVVCFIGSIWVQYDLYRSKCYDCGEYTMQ